jgi:hypothetical protein
VDGDVVEDREAAGGVELGLHEGEDLGEGVHALGGSRGLMGLGWRDDWTNHTDFQYRSSGDQGPSSD